MRLCEDQMPCGHACKKHCHIIDKGHVDAYKECAENCEHSCEQNHRCKKKCHYGEECGKCMVKVEKYRALCQHYVRVSCSVDPSTVACDNPCEKKRSCDHQCRGTCGQLCDTVVCDAKVEEKSPCGHTVSIECSNAGNDSKLSESCKEPCNIELKCGHLCKGSCAQCKWGRLHIR